MTRKLILNVLFGATVTLGLTACDGETNNKSPENVIMFAVKSAKKGNLQWFASSFTRETAQKYGTTEVMNEVTRFVDANQKNLKLGSVQVTSENESGWETVHEPYGESYEAKMTIQYIDVQILRKGMDPLVVGVRCRRDSQRKIGPEVSNNGVGISMSWSSNKACWIHSLPELK